MHAAKLVSACGTRARQRLRNTRMKRQRTERYQMPDHESVARDRWALILAGKWSDYGAPQRVMNTVARLAVSPDWLGRLSPQSA